MKYVKQLSDIRHQIAQAAEPHNKCTHEERGNKWEESYRWTTRLTGEFQAAVAERRSTDRSLGCTLSPGDGAGSPWRLGSFSLLSRVLERKRVAQREPCRCSRSLQWAFSRAVISARMWGNYPRRGEENRRKGAEGTNLEAHTGPGIVHVPPARVGNLVFTGYQNTQHYYCLLETYSCSGLTYDTS